MLYRNLSEVEAETLRAWTYAWLVECAEAGFVEPPYAADDATIEHATALFYAGLEPAEAAQVMYGTLH